MAERLENVMKTGMAEVSHNGQKTTVNLPTWFTTGSFFDENELLEHCKNHGILLATLQAGFAQHLIDLRAAARPADKKNEAGKLIKQPLDPDKAQERVSQVFPEPREPVKTRKAKTLEEIIADMKQKGMSNDEIKAEMMKHIG